jgi:hypothetical protein
MEEQNAQLKQARKDIRVAFTHEGPRFIADMEAAGIENVEGVNFSVQRKSEMASLLKQGITMANFIIYCLTGNDPTEGTSAAN